VPFVRRQSPVAGTEAGLCGMAGRGSLLGGCGGGSSPLSGRWGRAGGLCGRAGGLSGRSGLSGSSDSSEAGAGRSLSGPGDGAGGGSLLRVCCGESGSEVLSGMGGPWGVSSLLDRPGVFEAISPLMPPGLVGFGAGRAWSLSLSSCVLFGGNGGSLEASRAGALIRDPSSDATPDTVPFVVTGEAIDCFESRLSDGPDGLRGGREGGGANRRVGGCLSGNRGGRLGLGDAGSCAGRLGVGGGRVDVFALGPSGSFPISWSWLETTGRLVDCDRASSAGRGASGRSAGAVGRVARGPRPTSPRFSAAMRAWIDSGLVSSSPIVMWGLRV
jgi:hypothetical protein